jgi:hypothetical protein
MTSSAIRFDAGLSFRTKPAPKNTAESPVTVTTCLLDYFRCMSVVANNVIAFPIHRRREVRGCPHCGTRNDVWQIGQLLWGYCELHEVRWVVQNYHVVTRATINRGELRKGLEFLSAFVEVSH